MKQLGSHDLYHNIDSNPLIQDIKSDLANGFDCVIIVVGRRRMGKSSVSMKLAEAIDPGFVCGPFPADNTNQNFFTIPEFKHAINTRAHELEGKPVCLQEMGVQVYKRNYAKEANKTFNMVMQLIGLRRLCLIWTLPSISMLDKDAVAMANYIIRVTHRDNINQQIFSKVKKIDHNPESGVTYKKTFRFWQKAKARPSIIGLIIWKKPNKKLFDDYTKADEAYKNWYMEEEDKREDKALITAERKAKRELARDAKEGLE